MAVKKVLEDNLTVAQTRELIKEIKAKYLKSQSTKSKEVKTAIAKISKIDKDTLITASPDQLAQLQKVLRKKLAEVEALI